MIRINLIPPEILQRRIDERRWGIVALGALIVVVAVGLFYVVTAFQVSARESEVASIKQQAANTLAETNKFQVFQQTEADLAGRKAAVSAASVGRVDWARMLNELGLVLPTEMSLTAFNGSEGTAGQAGGTVTMSGQAIDRPDDNSKSGYKAIAKALVRLADLKQLDSVWLTNAAVNPTAADTSTVPLMSFDFTAKTTPQAALSPVTITPSGN